MRKNVASQTVGATMVSATDGSAFTGAVTVYVTGDGGVQALGSVGSGACTHEGESYHSYAPAQAETNYDHVAFTFKGSGAVPATVQVYTAFPQTGDSFARLGAPAGASVSADVAAIKAETATILADTNDIQTRLPAALVSGRMDSSVGAMAANTMTAAAAAADLTTELQSGLATAAALDAVDNFIDTEIADIQSRLPAALVGGRMDSSVGAMAANVLTATAINADAFTAAKFAADVTTELQTGLATAASITSLDGKIDTIDNFVDTEVAAIKAVTDLLPDAGALTSLATQASVNTIDDFLDTEIADIRNRLPAALVGGRMDSNMQALADAVITNVKFAAGAIDAAALAADAATEIRDAILNAALAELTGDPTATPAVKDALMLLFMAIRNKRDTTGATDEIHNSAGAVILTANLSDDTVTFSKAKYA